jgi:hypothetical protein
MSIQIPLRLKIEQNGSVKGYVETLNFLGGTVAVNGPVVDITGGGDTDRATAWARLGIAVQAANPGAGITYAAWVAGGTGFWGWIRLP